ncbi:hypothetical protein ACHAQH_007016 [Verticillium albo-atrum]
MRLAFLIAVLVTVTNGLLPRPSESIFTIELGPGKIRTVTEAEKQDLEAAGHDFIDHTPSLTQTARVDHKASVHSLSTLKASSKFALDHIITLNATALAENLLGLTTFHTRFYKSQTGVKSSEWLLERIQSYIDEATTKGVQRATVMAFEHTWVGQKSIIVRLKGKGDGVVVLGAHQDSINQLEPEKGHAPGADDNGTGSITILEALRAILDSDLAIQDSEHSVEFHWYAGEEVGLLGSKAIFEKYAEDGVNVVAMLNFDMTGYVKPGTTPIMGVITDNVDPKLAQTMRETIEKVDTSCGYECSDHASATRNGFPSAFIFESAFENSNGFIHTANDTIEKVDFGHVYEFAKLAVAAAYELAW